MPKLIFLLVTAGRPLCFPSYTTHWGTPSKFYSYSVLRTEAVEQRSESRASDSSRRGYPLLTEMRLSLAETRTREPEAGVSPPFFAQCCCG